MDVVAGTAANAVTGAKVVANTYVYTDCVDAAEDPCLVVTVTPTVPTAPAGT
jgi:hypothetical protein